MSFGSTATPEFWNLYRQLSPDVRALARKSYQIWQRDAFHPSLHFKKLNGPLWSVRIGLHFRAIGGFQGDQFLWTWIGNHAEYDRLI